MRRAFLLTVLAFALPAGAARAGEPPDVNWNALLPALGVSAKQPGAVPGCRHASLGCIRGELVRMRALQKRYGCDHRGVFDTTYLELTRTLDTTMRAEKRFFVDPRYIEREDALFAHVYFSTMDRWSHSKPVAAAWRIAMQAAASPNITATQDMLLGINAHVQNDMPFVIAALGNRMRSGASRKRDHDQFNEILRRAYASVIKAVRDRFDPFLDLSNPPAIQLDDIAGLQLVRGWREEVWRNAEALLGARTAADRRRIADRIEANAAATAQVIAAPTALRYGATRDAYCRAHLHR